MGEAKTIELEDMTRLRTVSQKISQHLRHRLDAHLATLMPLFAPRRVLGELMESAYSNRVPGAEKNVAAIEAAFKDIAQDSFGINASLSRPIPNISNTLTVHPWQYLYPLDEQGGATVVITSPMRWVIAYTGAPSLPDLIEAQRADERPGGDAINQLILRSLTLKSVMESTTGLAELLADLRFAVSFETTSVAGNVPFVVLSSPVPAFRPQDDVVKTVIGLSGMPVFEELVDVDALAMVEDPLKAQIMGFLD